MNRKYVVIIFILFMVLPLFSQSEIVMDRSFFSKFSRIRTISRDDYLEGYINGIVIGRGKITSITESSRYKKKFRVVVESTDSSRYNQRFTFFLFLDNRDTADLLTAGTDFEFKGQFMGYTPLNTRRNSYIIDVVLMDASTVIE
ncbi:MAG TPA: hypothetical protein PK358_15120 [Spirochaetota bacterium]|nr:hypothetical protein [Spirochaetota bacterium]HPJ36170.1 hypothetical protein [Spirochaetota bacterium]